MAFLAVLRGMLLCALAHCAASRFDSVLSLFTPDLATSIAKSTIIPKKKDIYVNRPALEEQILAIYNNVGFKSDSYAVVVGPRGAGKSFTVSHVLENKLGVVNIHVDDSDTPHSLLVKLLRCGGVTVTDNLAVGIDALGLVLENAASKRDGHRRITVLFDVNKASSSDSVLRMLQSTAKQLAGSANVIVVLSEGNAGIVFRDDGRQKFIWVEGMSSTEGRAYAKELYPQVDNKDLELFFDKVYGQFTN